MSFFAGRHLRCPLCSQRLVAVGRDKVVECYHRGVVAHLIGTDIPVILDVEMQQPGEGELPAARRLLERLLERHGRLFDAVMGDALYMESQLFNLCLAHRKHALAVLKGNNPSLLEDASSLMRGQPYLVRQEDQRLFKYWDEEGFSHQSIEAPLRVLRTEEVSSRRTRRAGKWVREEQTSTWMWATTIPQSQVSPEELGRIAHQRWHIENRVFKALSSHWGLDHCFHHHPQAMMNFILALFIAYTLVQCFHLLNMKEPLRRRHSAITVAVELLRGINAMPRGGAPWVNPRNNSPPR